MSIIFIIITLLLIFFAAKKIHKYNREKYKTASFNPDWLLILQKNIKIYNKLPEALELKLQGLINVFLHEKIFSGYNGLEITDEIKVTITAQACLLVLNRGDDLYPYLKNIYVYPGAFKSKQEINNGMVKTMKETVRIGESWQLGHVVLSWYHSKEGGLHEKDGHNVVYHEFAHQLDNEDGVIDGTPILNSAEDYKNWSEIFSCEYHELKNKIRKNKKSLIDYYGGESEGEFFAVVTELFFERPHIFNQEHPALYAALRDFYRLDPQEWWAMPTLH